MKTGDVIEINTKYGSKGAKLIRDGVETDYFRYIDVDSTFMQLAIGDNMFRYDAASGVNFSGSIHILQQGIFEECDGMELRVFDKTVQPLGAIDELASLLWHTKYFDVGTFKPACADYGQ